MLFLKWQLKTLDILQNRSRKPHLEDIQTLLSEYNQISLPDLTKTERDEDNSDAMEEEKENEMVLESAIEEYPEKKQLEILVDSSKEWLEKYNDILKRSAENLQIFNSDLESQDDGSMVIEELGSNEESN